MEVAVHEKNAVLKLGDPFCSFVYENEKISRIRIKAICYAIYLLGIYYIVMLVRGVSVSYTHLDVYKRQVLIYPYFFQWFLFKWRLCLV